MTFGLMLSASNEEVLAGIPSDPIGTLATILPTWFLVPFLVAVIMSLISGAVLGIYSSGLTLLSLGVRVPRPAAALVDGIILTLGTFFVVFVAQDFLGPFQSFLITLGVPLASWAGIMIADIALRKRDRDDIADHYQIFGQVAGLERAGRVHGMVSLRSVGGSYVGFVRLGQR